MILKCLDYKHNYTISQLLNELYMITKDILYQHVPTKSNR
jgi:hypothetical protein